MAMFDIENSENVELESNKTDREKLAKVKNVKGFKAKKNEVNTTNEPQKLKDDIVELKPNFMGFGLNLRALWQKCFRKCT